MKAGVVLLVLVCLAGLAGAQAVLAAAPSNDAFATPTLLAAAGGTLATSSAEATKEAGEPNHAGDAGGASIWFSWTPGFTGTASVDTSGSDFDTLLGAYTGSSVSALTRVASNDDISGTGTTSRICFSVTAGTTYAIAVDGYAGDSGNVALAWGSKADAAPCPILPPTVSGTTSVGQTLTTTDGTWVGSGLSFSRQWYRCAAEVCTSISGATGSTYALQPRDVGTDLIVDVDATDGTNTSHQQSDPTSVVGMATTLGTNGRVFFGTDRNDPSQYDVYAANPDGTATVPIRATTDFETEPAPSPDGSKIAYNDLTSQSLVIA